MPYDLRTIDENCARIDRDVEGMISYYREQGRERRRKVELNYQAAALLDAAGYDLGLSQWSHMEWITVDLGRVPERKRERAAFVLKLAELRRLLDCPLKFQGRSLAGERGQWVEVRLKPADFPGVTVTYQQRLLRKAGQKCKIVTRRVVERVLVCEASS
jgi:hypothetical protein